MLMVVAVLVVGAARAAPWRCPELSRPPSASCSCDLPHTVRCSGDRRALDVIGASLRGLPGISLLDITIQDNVTSLDRPVLPGVALHGLVVSSGEIRHVSEAAFSRLRAPLQALGLPNNRLEAVPTRAVAQLRALDRLDLSHNGLRSLGAGSFAELEKLTFLDVSDNSLERLEPGCFSPLAALRTLRLRGNQLGLAPVGVALLGLPAPLQELDLGDNSLLGPLGPATLPPLPALLSLQLARNQLSSVQRAALRGTRRLQSLGLRFNQIDVLEDDAFSELASLERLDLSHNRIVAVSGASLAHLARLESLDLSHNFLRALAADLVRPLHQLRRLHLDDNDVTMVPAATVALLSPLRRLTLADNPLNCDCSLARFAEWLANDSALAPADRATAVCATPPSLENGVLRDVPRHDLVCGDDELAPPQGPLAPAFPVASQVALRAFQYDGATISTVWAVSPAAMPYTCDNLFVYEEVDSHEVLAESSPLQCNSSTLADPHLLPVSLPAGGFLPGRQYRYCLVLLVGGDSSDEVSLGLGCSDMLLLAAPPGPRIAALHANVTGPGSVQLRVQLRGGAASPGCALTATVEAGSREVARASLNCSAPGALLRGLPPAPYRVCAWLEGLPGRSCAVAVPAAAPPARGPGPGVLLPACLAAGVALLLALLAWLGARRLRARPVLAHTHQCFLAGPPGQQQHSRYVKLHATTVL
ncbi:protein slit-like [Bacillus rossius redtenbacheri]|uniref:protein slit-like n=1 Tax=Bacillus rossius redtenbacheri TaxID=93214 RepID=UPI002FDD70AF